MLRLPLQSTAGPRGQLTSRPPPTPPPPQFRCTLAAARTRHGDRGRETKELRVAGPSLPQVLQRPRPLLLLLLVVVVAAARQRVQGGHGSCPVRRSERSWTHTTLFVAVSG